MWKNLLFANIYLMEPWAQTHMQKQSHMPSVVSHWILLLQFCSQLSGGGLSTNGCGSCNIVLFFCCVFHFNRYCVLLNTKCIIIIIIIKKELITTKHINNNKKSYQQFILHPKHNSSKWNSNCNTTKNI